MKTVFLALVLTALAASQISVKSKSERAFDIRNALDFETHGTYGFPANWLRDIRWKNTQHKFEDCPLVSELTSVVTQKTVDSGDLVIELRSVDGETCSLWLRGSEENVRLPVWSISSY